VPPETPYAADLFAIAVRIGKPPSKVTMPGTKRYPGSVVISPICFGREREAGRRAGLELGNFDAFQERVVLAQKYFRLPPVSTMANSFSSLPAWLLLHTLPPFSGDIQNNTGRCSSAIAEPARAVNRDTRLIESKVFFMDFPLEKVLWSASATASVLISAPGLTRSYRKFLTGFVSLFCQAQEEARR